LFDVKAAGFKDPLLVASTDGVGTKLLVAIEAGNFRGLGQDLVAMCVNDVVVQGAQPLFFLDYFASGKLDVDAAAVVIEGVAKACKECACALIGGETAEMPGLYGQGHFDLAGFTVGAVERDQVLPRTDHMHPGDILIGVASSGVHANGFSLVRRIVADSGIRYSSAAPFAPHALGDALLTPTRLYVKSALTAIGTGGVKGMAHITGGGITENLPRVLPSHLDAAVDLQTWHMPHVFRWLCEASGLDDAEMLRTFNCGIGLIVVAAADKAGHIIDAFGDTGERAFRIGELVRGKDGKSTVRYSGALPQS
jgi:phosphoribosylformylglycinamidine cyclo-ligase